MFVLFCFVLFCFVVVARRHQQTVVQECRAQSHKKEKKKKGQGGERSSFAFSLLLSPSKPHAETKSTSSSSSSSSSCFLSPASKPLPATRLGESGVNGRPRTSLHGQPSLLPALIAFMWSCAALPIGSQRRRRCRTTWNVQQQVNDANAWSLRIPGERRRRRRRRRRWRWRWKWKGRGDSRSRQTSGRRHR